jgi:signal transduction histidine kinase
LLARGRSAESLTQITELQSGVSREFDEVRAYVRSLADLELRASAASASGQRDMRIRFEAAFEARALVVEQIIQIMLEGMRNALRHGHARRAIVTAAESGGTISVRIDDDGIGFGAHDAAPWAIASRVAEFGGRLTMSGAHPSGAHLEIEMPAA